MDEQRKRLNEIICAQIQDECFRYCNHPYCDRVENITDHLLAEGVIVPPVKVGDTIYKLCGNRIYEFTVHALSINANINSCDILMCVYDEDNDNARYSCAWIGKTVFLTKEEAEKALAERNK